MVMDPFGAAVPLGAGIAERGDEFLLSCIDADAGRLSAAQRSRSSVMCRNWSSRLGCWAPASSLWLTRSE